MNPFCVDHDHKFYAPLCKGSVAESRKLKITKNSQGSRKTLKKHEKLSKITKNSQKSRKTLKITKNSKNS